jgi:hypothetical protein
MRLPLFIALGFISCASSTVAEERSTRVPIGTLQMTGRGTAQPPESGALSPIEAAPGSARAMQVQIPIGTLQMTGQAQPAER